MIYDLVIRSTVLPSGQSSTGKEGGERERERKWRAEGAMHERKEGRNACRQDGRYRKEGTNEGREEGSNMTKGRKKGRKEGRNMTQERREGI